MSDQPAYPTYESLGVRPLINCQGTYTIISGSLILPAVRQAMVAASKQYVHLDELMEAVGTRIGELMQCEWGLVTNGCAAALCQVTAACVAGTDPEQMARLPDTTGMRNQVLVQPSHRHGYDHAVRMVGVELVEVETLTELDAALSDRTAMLLVFGDAAERGQISVADMAAAGQRHGVPTLVDAAAERPDAPNWYLEQGVDAVAYSGGKCLRGPQASGLVLGRKELLQAAFLNGAPHHALGRPMKAGKEEIMGLLAAVEQWVVRDHAAEWREWERRLAVIADAVEKFTLGDDAGQPAWALECCAEFGGALGPGAAGNQWPRAGASAIGWSTANRSASPRERLWHQSLYDGTGRGKHRGAADKRGFGRGLLSSSVGSLAAAQGHG